MVASRRIGDQIINADIKTVNPQQEAVPVKKQKPKLRGVSHHYAAVAFFIAGSLLTLDAASSDALIGCIIYTAALTCLFTTSAVYHRLTWDPKKRATMRRLDHTSIYLLIAGTYTPLCLLALDQLTGRRLLLLVWLGAAAGIAHSLLNEGGFASKIFSATIYVALGWIVLPYASHLKTALGPLGVALIVAGGIVYSVGVSFDFILRIFLIPRLLHCIQWALNVLSSIGILSISSGCSVCCALARPLA